MSIAEKLTTIADNQQKVYDAGYAAGQAEGEVDTARAASVYRIADPNAFKKKDVTIHFDCVTDYYSFCQDTPQNTTVEHLTIIASKPATRVSMFMYQGTADYTLTRLTIDVDWSQAPVSNCFYNLRALKVIDGRPIDLSATTVDARFFYMLTALEHCLFAPSSIKVSLNLSDAQYLDGESVQSVIDGLIDLTGQTTKNVTLHRNIALTDEQKATISGKNWTLVQ